jgi:NAD(P)-dependent dehydrogenase (short-subunit alcohol dehydrogenase family)
VHGFGIFVTVVAPGLFQTPMSEAFGSCSVAGDSPYAAAFAVMIEQSVAEVAKADDPDLVARAIDDCIRAGDPPARLVVGAGAEEMDKTVRAASPDDLAKMMREYVASLTADQ